MLKILLLNIFITGLYKLKVRGSCKHDKSNEFQGVRTKLIKQMRETLELESQVLVTSSNESTSQ